MAKLTINYYSVKSNIWLKKGTSVEVIQYVGASYVLVNYKEQQVIVPVFALEVYNNGS